MGSIDSSPQSWVPTYMNVRDCSLGYCSRFCPEWCYVFVPPPPSFEIAENNSSSSPTFSPLVIAIIGILVSAFLLVSYYTIMSKYCGNEDRRSRSVEDYGPTEELEGTPNPSIHEPWYVVTVGLDEALINSLTVWKYKKEDKLVEGTDCAVCLSEFEEDESLRLLPKCNHAFHLPCIDTWLKSHSNCPLCRANITSIDAPTPQLPRVVTEAPPSISNDRANVVMATQDSERGHRQSVEMVHGDVAPKTPSRAFSDLGNSEERDAIIEIGGDDAFHLNVRRSVSMDYYSQHRVSVADILRMNEEEDEEHVHGEGCSETDEIAGSSKQSTTGRVGMSSHRKGNSRNVPAMNRSFSSGRLFQSRPARARHTVIPL